MDNSNFDILEYLNDMYVMNMTPQINMNHAGGHYNRYGDDSTTDKEILKINKKRIHIPNASIKPFSGGQQEYIEEYNETETESDSIERRKQRGKGDNEVSVEREQEGSSSDPLAQEIVEI